MLKKVHYINLDDRPDRKLKLLEEIKRYGLSDEQIVRFPAIKMTPGYVGCSLSHVNLLKEFLDNDALSEDYVVILEDDFVWKMDPMEAKVVLDRFHAKVVNCGQSWDVLILAAVLGDLKTTATEVEGIHRCHSAQTTTGYIVRRGYMSRLISLFQMSVEKLQSGEPYGTWAIDQVWKKLQSTDKWFITIPGVGKQAPGFSDIEMKIASYTFA